MKRKEKKRKSGQDLALLLLDDDDLPIHSTHILFAPLQSSVEHASQAHDPKMKAKLYTSIKTHMHTHKARQSKGGFK